MQTLKGKCFEHNVEIDLFRTKLVFKTKEQECNFINEGIFHVFSVGSVSFWPCRWEVEKKMIEIFKQMYRSTQCRIDCIEHFCQRSSSLIVQSFFYSRHSLDVTYKWYEKNHTYEQMCEDMNRTILNSNFYHKYIAEVISDKKNCSPKWFTEWSTLGEKNESIIEDRDFLILDYLENIGASLNISAFLNGSEQLAKAKMKEIQAIASLRICWTSKTTN